MHEQFVIKITFPSIMSGSFAHVVVTQELKVVIMTFLFPKLLHFADVVLSCMQVELKVPHKQDFVLSFLQTVLH